MNSRFLLLNFDIYTMIFIKHLLSRYLILHQKLKVILLTIQNVYNCNPKKMKNMVIMTKTYNL
jgi:hypothetical protein